jgi:trk system potassium uptake protein TrkA
MHAIIVGCGRVGSTLARELDAAGHEVVIIDRRTEAFRRLGDGFGGRVLTGVGFDRDLLEQAGISPDSVVAAVTSGDNSNILIARVARELFGARRVVARIYDPQRASVYERLGIATVATVAWTTTRILRLLQPLEGSHDWTDPTSTYVLAERRVSADVAATSVAEWEARGLRVTLLTRNGRAAIPDTSVLLQEGDLVHVMAPIEALETLDGLGTAATGGTH